ncbi:MAG: hypothetical protein ACI4JN_03655 [Ruminococcus sp.]
MVKGVHKKIIEVRSPGGEYFEKAVFYLRPGVNQLPPEITETAAQMILEEFEHHGSRKTIKTVLLTSAAVLTAAVISVCLFILFA